MRPISKTGRSADDEALEVELERDAQRHVEVERVEVGRERARRRAAVDRLQHRRLDLDEAVAVQHVADGAHDRGAVGHHPAAVGVHDEVDVALADAQLGVGQAVVLVRQRAQRLAREQPLRRQDAELPAAAADDLAGDADVVAEVDVGLPVGEPLLADAVQAHHDLQRGVGLLQRREAELAADAAEHHPSGDADDLAAGRVDREVGVPLAHLGQRRGAGRADRVRRRPRGPQPLDLLAPDPDLLRDVGGRGRSVAHPASLRTAVPPDVRRRTRQPWPHRRTQHRIRRCARRPAAGR
jgi:hypothetical protein